MKERVVIMGAGIQGVCCALALSNLGIPVTLIDKVHQPMLRASLRNEGKIHLGFIYANDSSFQSASLMLRSAMSFAPLMDSFTGYKINWGPLRSRRFNYLILNDTIIPRESILAHYAQLQAEYDKIRNSDVHYLGTTPEILWANTHLHIRALNKDKVQMCIPTNEFALNLDAFRSLVLQELARRSNIQFLGGHCIEEIQKTSFGYRVSGKKEPQQNWTLETEQLINCLWENRLLFDQQLGITTNRKWVYRLKNRIMGFPSAPIAALDSFTCVLGAFGDLVNYDNHMTYLSWYPHCMSGWSTDITTPPDWERSCNGQLNHDESKEWVQKALAGLDDIFPGLAHFDIRKLDGGIIFSWGKTDIDDINSELHNRYEIGVHHHDGYFSIDTGKFTSAPYFAKKLQNFFA